MKSICILFFALIMITSCKKESTVNNSTFQNGISYPDSVYFGNNLLNYPDSSILTEGINYELGTILENDASLYLIFTNCSDTTGLIPCWFLTHYTGWINGNYNPNYTQKIIASAGEKNSFLIQFLAFGKTGKCKLDFYENGNTITHTKHFCWH